MYKQCDFRNFRLYEDERKREREREREREKLVLDFRGWGGRNLNVNMLLTMCIHFEIGRSEDMLMVDNHC